MVAITPISASPPHSRQSCSWTQTKGSGMEAASVPTQPVYRCVVSGASVRASLLVRTWNQAFVATSASGSSSRQSKASSPGRMMTMVPAKPPSTSAQRWGDTRSPSVRAASNVMTRGVIMTMAVNSPTGMVLRLRNASRLLVNSSTPRSTWKRGWAVRSIFQPWRGSTMAVVATAWNA